jgi:hypothetical protein
MHGHPHQPGANERAILGAGAVDVRGRELPRARAKREPRRKAVLSLAAGYLPRDLDRIVGRGRPVKKLGSCAPPSQVRVQ